MAGKVGDSKDFRIEVEIKAPPEVVWSVMRDVEKWPEWTPTVSRVRLLDRGPLHLGSRAIIHQPKLLPAKWRVTELHALGRRFTWISSGPGIRVIAVHGVAASGTASRATLSLRFEGLLAGLFSRLLRDLNNRYLALEAKGLKQRSEARAA
jgi:uncharacterized membrane protein